MSHQPMSHEEFELAAREMPPATPGEAGLARQVGGVIFAGTPSEITASSTSEVSVSYYVQVAELIDEVARASQENEAL